VVFVVCCTCCSSTHLVAGQCVERAERLVEQQQPGVAEQGAGDGDALAHAARQFPGLPVGEVADAQLGQQGARPLGRRAARQALHLGRDQHVVEDVAPVEQQVALEDDADPVHAVADRLAADHDAALARPVEPAQDAQERALAAAAGADDGRRAAALDGDVERPQRMHGAPAGAIGALDAFDDDLVHGPVHLLAVGCRQTNTSS
jgi:hypothetical protein